ncbi:MAG TPA: phosphatase PAP2 family protein [Terracidiphilus sp.]|nr:phosphatase PAP2 family protein [Terracidiphilus sp.]
MEVNQQRGRPRWLLGFGFHHQLAYASAAILIFCWVGGMLTSTVVPQARWIILGTVFVIAGISPLPIYLQQRKKTYWFDAVMTVLWALFLFGLLHFPIDVAARLGARIPLRDSALALLDQKAGVHVPALVAWASHHWIGHFANRSYGWLGWMLAAAVLVPILTGNVKHARQFLIANVVAFAIGLPLFIAIPAVGPWYGFHFAPDAGQALCQSAYVGMRTAQFYAYRGDAGVVCFPSFHVVWAILCAQALWGLRPLRIPIAALSGLIVLSTLTTGWHYFCDVLAGIAIAAVSIAISGRLLGADVPAASRETVPEKELATHG